MFGFKLSGTAAAPLISKHLSLIQKHLTCPAEAQHAFISNIRGWGNLEAISFERKILNTFFCNFLHGKGWSKCILKQINDTEKTKLVWILKLGDCCQTGIKILDKEKLVWVSGTHWRDGGHQFKLTTLHKAGKLGHLVNKHKETNKEAKFKFKKVFF